MDPNNRTLTNESEARSVAKNTPEFKNELSEIELTPNSIGVEAVFALNLTEKLSVVVLSTCGVHLSSSSERLMKL